VGFEVTLVLATAVYGLAGIFLIREFRVALSAERNTTVAPV